jgi:glutamine synthetase
MTNQSMSSLLDVNQVLSRVEKNQIKFIDLQFTDVVGVVKNVTIPAQELQDAIANGIWFDGSSIEGFARIAESDMHLRPVISSFAILPWLSGEEATARLICDIFTPDGQPFAGDPRSVLRRAVAQAEQMSFCYNTGPELEFFLLKPNPDGSLIPPIAHDSASYFDAPSDMAGGLRRQMTATVAAFGIQVEAMHHEVATGQHEIDFRYSDALTTADNAVTFRLALKIIAQLNGLYGTFMPKPIRGIAGNGMHVHQSLVFTKSGKNAFADPGDEHGLSKIAKHFIAGQLAHARGMCAVLAPLVNSYKRLVAGYEAPVYVSWARINRSAMIRVPRASNSESTRLELRTADPSCNPYLAFAVMLAAGLDGIRRELPVPPATEENLFVMDSERLSELEILPESLNRALDALEEDQVICEALGAHTCERFISAKRLEWQDYRLEVTHWELSKYLSNY